MSETPASGPEHPPTELNTLRWRLIRDLAVFSAKASLEALRDLVLIPVALLAGFAGLVLSPRDPAVFFARVLDWGDRYDHFVDLFGSARLRDRAGLSSLAPARRDAATTADDVFAGLERALLEQHERGGITVAAKETIDRALDVLQEAVEDLTHPAGPESEDRKERPRQPGVPDDEIG